MKASDVTWFCDRMTERGIGIWLDGGWGVDALLGVQTRNHGDLDIVAQKKDADAVVRFLESEGFRPLERDDSCPWNFVMGDGRGREVDFHVILFDRDGNGTYGPPEGGAMYPAAALQGEGQVKGLRVRCLTAQYQVLSHTGYAVDETDYRDVRALADRFGLKIPEAFRAFEDCDDE